MQFSDDVIAIVAMANKRHADIQEALDQAEREIRALPNFDDIVSDLIRHAIQELIYSDRHTVNTKIKRETGQFTAQPKVKMTGAVLASYRAERSLLDLNIQGLRLGDMTGADLRDAMGREEAQGRGSLTNSRFLRRIDARYSPKDDQVLRTVKGVTDGELRKIWKQAEEEIARLVG